MKSFFKNKWVRRILVFAIPFGVAQLLLVGPFLYFSLINSEKIHKVNEINENNSLNLNEVRTGIVFGAGIRRDGQPNSILRERLDSASTAFHEGLIHEILISGNNDLGHFEVDSMHAYLTQIKGIPSERILQDGYGYRTYDTCVRARQIFEIKSAYLFTSVYHLPRTVYLCETLGVDSVGLYSRRFLGNNFIIYTVRELGASHKALLDTLISEPDYSEEAYEAPEEVLWERLPQNMDE